MRILHTESSNGWGGQEIRILHEMIEMRKRGHEMILAVVRNGKLIEKARKEGFCVYELPFSKQAAAFTIWKLLSIIKRHSIDVINTHSSLDAWIGGLVGRIAKKRIVRTRHLSTPIRSGLNSYLLYKCLVDFVVTTSSCIVPVIATSSKLDPSLLRCIPTGIDPQKLVVDSSAVAHFRNVLGLKENDILVGTCCFVRSWKGIDTLLQTAQILKDHGQIKWVIVGGGHVDDYRPKVKTMGLEHSVYFTGHMEVPFSAIAAMDIFMLLSTANEGVSQSSLQAAYLSRPLITTTVGGLPEICIHGKTGILVPPLSTEKTAEAVLALVGNPRLRQEFGAHAKDLVKEKFTLTQTINNMESVYNELLKTRKS